MSGIERFGWFALSSLFGAAALSAQGGDSDITSTLSLLMLLTALCGCASWVKHSPRHGAILSALLCAACNLYLLSSKIDAEAGFGMCGADGGGCGVLNQLPQSEVLGFPVTLFGAMFYLALAVATFLGNDEDTTTYQLNAVLGSGGLAFCVYLGGVAFSVGVFCPFCVTIYIATVLILWGALRGLGATGGTLFGQLGPMFGSSTFLVWIATFTIGLLLGIPYVETQSQPGTNPKRFQTPQPTAQPGPRANPAPKNVLDGLAMEVLGEVTVDGTEPLLGRADAPYLIVEWADYGCPHCALAATGLKGLVESTPDVQVRFKNFPLSGLCNPNIPTQEQVERCLSAIAAKCTQDQGKFWEYQSAIFANQTYLFLQSPSFEQDLANIADRVGVNRERWEACITDEGVADVIREEARQGGQAGVLGTPFITLQGVYDRPVQVPDVRAATMLIEAHKLGRSLPAPAPHASL